MPSDHLVDDLTGVEAAIAVLVNTAAVANELLTDEQRIIAESLLANAYSGPLPEGWPSRGFAPLDLGAPTGVPAAEPPETARPEPRRHR